MTVPTASSLALTIAMIFGDTGVNGGIDCHTKNASKPR